MPLSGSAMWAILLPSQKTNLLLNPSAELGTAGWGTVLGGTVGTTSQFQQFGAWSGSIAPDNSLTAGAHFGAFSAGSGTAYTFSAYARLSAGRNYIIGVSDTSDVLTASAGMAGGGTWHRYSVSYTEDTGASRRVTIRKDANANTDGFYVDGLQVEVGSITTYCDGDQEGCTWIGQRHASQSLRSGQSRAGGTVIALADLGFTVEEEIGLGMPPLDTTYQSYALAPGAEFQYQRAEARQFTLAARVEGTTWRDFHNTRRNLIAALRIDSVSEQQPIRFWYVGGEGTIQLDAYLDDGPTGANRSGFTEFAPLRFIAADPYWSATTDQGTALAPRTNIGSANYIVKRDGLGRWGTLGASGTTLEGVDPNGGIRAMLHTNGTLVIGGQWGTTAGTVYPNIALYYPQLNTFGTLSGGTLELNGASPERVRALAQSPAGSLYVGGNIAAVGGTAARLIGQWNGAWGTLHGGTINVGGGNGTHVSSLAYANGTLFVGGYFDVVQGTTGARMIVQWVNSAWGTLTSGTVNDEVRGMAYGIDNRLYVGGDFSFAGTSASRVAFWNGQWGTMGAGASGAAGGAPNVFAVASEPNAKVVAAGKFQVMGVGSALDIAEWNGVQWAALGSGLTTSVGGTTQITGVYADQNTGDIYAGGQIARAGGVAVPDGIARWNGYTWLPADINIAGGAAGTVHVVLSTPDNTLYLAGTFTGQAQAAAVAQVVNAGGAEVFPVFRARNSGSGTIRVYQLINTLTSDALYFNVIMQPGEEITLSLAPGSATFTSSAQGNIFGRILPGSNLATWRLLPGTNWVSLFADSDNLRSTLVWRPRFWSGDGTTL